MQTSYSVDRAGTAEQEAEAAEEALLADAPEGSGPSPKAISDMAEIVGAFAASLPKRVRRTREQIEQEKIEKAQQRIEAIKGEQVRRRVLKALQLVTDARRAVLPDDVARPVIDAIDHAIFELTRIGDE